MPDGKMISYMLVILVAILNMLSLTLFKLGVAQVGGFALVDLMNPVTMTLKILATPLLMLGLLTSVCTTVFWLTALSRLPASVAQPLMIGVFYVLLLAVSSIFLREDFNVQKLVAVVLISTGVVLLSWV
jgi:drug/metabolite transporter (DMT)-like permease